MKNKVICSCGFGLIVFFCFILMFSSVSAQNVTFDFRGKTYLVPENYLDPAFPSQDIAKGNLNSESYLDYVSKHAFPVKDENFSKNVEVWSVNNAFFPQFLPTGNPAADSVRYLNAVDKWTADNRYAVSLIVGNVNNSSLSDEEFDLLFFSFPRIEDFMDFDNCINRYNTAVNKWIRLYSYDKYLLIKPVVENSSANNI